MNFLKILINSFGDAQTYKYVIDTWKFKTLFYFVLITMITALSYDIILMGSANQFLDTTFKDAKIALKDVQIKDGLIVTPEGKDIEIKDDKGEVFAIASQNLLDANRAKNLALAFEKDRLTFVMPDGEQTFMLFSDWQIKGGNVLDILPSKNMLNYFIIPFSAIIMAFMVNSVFVSIITISTLILSRTLYPFISVFQSLKVSVLALTPSVFINIISILLFDRILDGFMYALISGGVIFFMLRKLNNKGYGNEE